MTLKNTIVANNAGGNCGGTITDGGHNLRWPSTDASCVGVFGDPQLGLLYWPTGNPCPDYNGDERNGDNLYTASVVRSPGAAGAHRRDADGLDVARP